MADFALGAGGLLQGFNSVYWPSVQRKEILAQQKAQQDAMNAYHQQVLDFQKQQAEQQRIAQQEALARQADKEQRISGGLLGMLPGVANGDPRQQQALTAGMPPEVAQLMVQRQFNEQDFNRNLGGQMALKRFEASLTPPPKEDVQIQEFEGPQGYGKYLFNPRNPSKMLFLGGTRSGDAKPPPGYQFVTGPGGQTMLSAIPGGPAAQKETETKTAQQAKEQARLGQANLVLEDIDRALNLSKQGNFGGILPSTGVGAALSWVPGSNAHDLATTLDTIRANVGFDKLQQMRESSPTGGALGQVSEKENALLQSVLGSLAQSQSQAQFSRNLERLKKTYLDIVHGAGNRREGWGGGVELKGQTLKFDENGNPVE